MKDDNSSSIATKIMALVDEFPSEPLSFERKKLEERISDIIAYFVDDIEQREEQAYSSGFDDGYSEGHDEGRIETEDEYESKIADMQTAHEEEKLEEYDKGIADGYETARAEHGF